MRQVFVIFALELLLGGCTTVKPPPKIEMPVSWAQQPEETGKLQVGKVAAVSIEQFDEGYYVSRICKGNFSSDAPAVGSGSVFDQFILGLVIQFFTPKCVSTSEWSSSFKGASINSNF